MDNLKQKTKQMTEQDKRRIDFGAATIHELKTSLTAIIVSAELLADELELDHESAPGKLIQGIIRSAHRMDEKLSSLPKVTELLVKDVQLQPEYLEIGQVIHDVTAQLYPMTQSRKQSLALEVSDFLPMVRADRRYLEQILLNLLTNASNFTSEGGKIKVSAWQDGDSLVTQVSDTGGGISVEEQERIFQPYYQLERNRSRKHAGSGLGLAITKLLVELHGGKIWLESIMGQGSSFFFSLPLQSCPQASRILRSKI